MSELQKKKRPWGSLAALTLFLIVFPAMSWYYLQKGATYRINSLREIRQNLGTMGDFAYQPANWGFLPKDSLIGKIIVVNMIQLNGQFAEKQTITEKKLHTQFGERKDIVLLSLLYPADSLTAFNYFQQQKVKRNQSYFVVAGDQKTKNQWLQTFGFGQKGDFSSSENPYYAYIDGDGTIRSFYDVNDEATIKKMVEHIAMKIFDKKENPRLTRELER